MRTQEIIVGARGSRLSVIQAENVISLLRKASPQDAFSLKKITTSGDKAKNWQRSEVGIFVKELEDALEHREIDIAIHSAKDLPSSLAEGLTLAAIPTRQDPRDCILTKEKIAFNSLKKNAIIGTSSVRRAAQFLRIRLDARIKNLRGNVDTRIKKLVSGHYDAIIVALAGLKRLGYTQAEAFYTEAPPPVGGGASVRSEKERFFIRPFPLTLMVPACGQGALGIEIRSDDQQVYELVRKINNEKSFFCVQCERAFLKEFGAGCRIPLGALAKIKGARIYLTVCLTSLDGKKIIRLSQKAGVHEAEALGKRLAGEVFKKAGQEILQGVRNLKK